MSNPETPFLHRLIRGTAGMAAASFFTEIRVIGGENVPKDGPIIVTATHHNMMLDPVILSVGFPHRRMLNYWSKATLFANPIARYILLSSGNIPVDRKSKDRQVLFKGTFEALAKGHAVALFPEGTSYTEPHIMQVKDGAAWSALEYTKWLKENPDKAPDRDVTIVPAAIVYTNKSKYRSGVIMEFGQPITLEAYKEQFFSDVEGAPRAAVKRLTAEIERELFEATINAPDWETLYSARMARDLLWEKDKSINLDEFVTISQTLVDLFATPDATDNITAVKRKLLSYYSLLQTTHLTNSVLSSLPLPRDLDPNTPATLPSRLFTLLLLIRDSISALSRLPFFLFPLVVHLPMYVMGRLGAKLAQDEEETQAQNKVAFGLISLATTYTASFFFLWALFKYTPTGAMLAAITIYLFANYHNKTIDANYERAKQFIAAWRLLVGVWVPKRWDLSMTALSDYLTPQAPPENPWIDRSKPIRKPVGVNNTHTSTTTTPSSSAEVVSPPSGQPTSTSGQKRRRRRPPTRRLMRHVLRARVEAIKALTGFFNELERTGGLGPKKVCASSHLARRYGDFATVPGEDGEPLITGRRDAREVIEFLRKRGAKIPTTGSGEREWAVLSSDGEGESGTPADEQDEPRWVVS
ncbi:glycerol-3-phosphate-acyltransferase [Pluteus cervinus]|uniref:Glycerol-3-phosphate-acyltransferase n=1 Tax=Pluteus cervinus TaxID=181527 RepID=A0ACD3B9G9_9AGAR|nr:glycerol-3-phosphate-acyltransferase [Pluteus cervinus]